MKKSILLLLWLPFTAAAQNSIPATLTLTANDQQQAIIYKNEPVIFSVSISNSAARYAAIANMPVNRRLNEITALLAEKKITQQQYDDEKKQLEAGKKTVPSVTIGGKAAPWFMQLQWKCTDKKTGMPVNIMVKYLPAPSVDSVAVLDGNGSYTAWFGYGPGVLPAGSYSVSVSMPGVQEAVAELDVSGKKRSGTKESDSETALLQAAYYWHANEPLQAINVLNNLLQKEPAHEGALTLRGDAYVLQKKYAEALKDYQAALSINNSNTGPYSEPPEYLLTMIAWIKSEMGK